MAKEHTAEQPKLNGPPIPMSNKPAEPMDELTRLRQENEILRGKLQEAEAKAPPHLSRQHQPGKYRVSLPGLKVKMSAIIVYARERRDFQPLPEKYAKCEPAHYEGEDLLSSSEQVDLQRLAWERYRDANKLTNADRIWFRVKPEQCQVQDSLDIVALSRADAYEKFCRYNGILATTRQPVIELLPVEAQAA